MGYSQILDGYEEYVTKMSLHGDDVLYSPYADYGAGIFGAYVIPRPEKVSQDADEQTFAIEALKATSPLIVWRKFARPLEPTNVVLSSLAALIAETDGKEVLVHYRTTGSIPSSVDYSGAESGTSRIYTITAASFSSASRAEKILAARRWSGLDWWFVLGLIPRPDVGSMAPSWGDLR